METRKLVIVLGFLAVVLIGFAYAFRWEYRTRGTLQIRTNRWTSATECFPSRTLLWTEVVKDPLTWDQYHANVTREARTGAPCSLEGVSGLGFSPDSTSVCKSHQVAAWGRCGH
jgi:hypothetical protein